jgi:hypothetical protein
MVAPTRRMDRFYAELDWRMTKTDPRQSRQRLALVLDYRPEQDREVERVRRALFARG